MSAHEIWHVKLPNGDTRSGTLDQLDEAFHAGAIDETTLVRREGTSDWITLAAAAGLEAEAAAPVAPPISAPPPAITTDLDDLDENVLAASKKKSIFIAAGAAVAVFALAGVFVSRVAASEAEKPSAAAGAAIPVVANVAEATPKSDDTAAPGRVLTEDQKKALLQADQQRQDEAHKRALSRPRTSPSVPSKDPFHKGGDKFDPLNSSL